MEGASFSASSFDMPFSMRAVTSFVNISLKATYMSPTRWSPFFPVDSGVAPPPTFSQAYMDLQMCTPLSLTSVALMTLFPLAMSSLETESPSRLFLM